jgi:hypothetical protein
MGLSGMLATPLMVGFHLLYILADWRRLLLPLRPTGHAQQGDGAQGQAAAGNWVMSVLLVWVLVSPQC